MGSSGVVSCTSGDSRSSGLRVGHHRHACLFSWCRPSLCCVREANQQAIRAFFAGLDEEAHDLAERLAHGDDESVWAWFERRYPKATKRAATGRHWREFVIAIREFYGDETRLQ